MANCMAKIAECLGVELNEVFRIEDWDSLLAQVKKALDDGNERKLHILIAKLESSHICPPDSYDHAFCPYCGECWWQWMMMQKEMLDM